MRLVRLGLRNLTSRPSRVFINTRVARWLASDNNNGDVGARQSLSDYKKLHPKPAIDLINQLAPIKVEGKVAVCDGGGGALGHPVEYIMLETREQNKVETCKYCGKRFVHASKNRH